MLPLLFDAASSATPEGKSSARAEAEQELPAGLPAEHSASAAAPAPTAVADTAEMNEVG